MSCSYCVDLRALLCGAPSSLALCACSVADFASILVIEKVHLYVGTIRYAVNRTNPGSGLSSVNASGERQE